MQSVVELRPREGRVPPQNLDSEGIVLSAVLLKPAEHLDDVLAIVRAHMFYSDANKIVMAAVTEMHETGVPIDVVSVAQHLQTKGELAKAGGTPYLADLTDKIPMSVSVGRHAEIVRDHWQSRQLIVTCQRYAAEAYAGETPAIDLIAAAETTLGDLASSVAKESLLHVSSIIETEVTTLRALRESGNTTHGTGISTGYAKLDKFTGGIHRTDLTIVAGRPGMGKTSFVMGLAANIARPTAQNSNSPKDAVAFFSLEMPKEQVAVRFACAERNVRISKVRQNDLGHDDWAAFQAGATELARFPIWIDGSTSVSILDLRTRVRKLQRDLKAGRGPLECAAVGVVIVDYLQLMRGIRGPNDNRESEVSSLSRGLKELAKDLDVAVIALSQLNRNPEKKGQKDRRPELSDLRESGAIEQDADNVWFVYREDYYDTEARKGDSEIIGKKQRNGPPFTAYFTFVGETTRFYEREPENYDDLSSDFEDR